MSAHGAHRTRTLVLTSMLHLFTHLYGVALLPLYLRIQQDLKLRSVEQATLLVTVMGVAYFLPSYPMGVLADRWSRKRLLASGLALNALGFVALSLARGYGGALAAMILAGVGGSFYHPAATALIARLFPESRGKALGLAGVGASVGFFFGPIYCGWRAVNTGNWRTPVLELGVLGLVAAVAFAALAEEERGVAGQPSSGAAGTGAGKRAGVRQPLFPTGALWFFFLAAALAFSLRDFAGSAMATSASLFLQNARGFDPKSAGLALSLVFLMSAVSNPLFGHLSDGGRMRWMCALLVAAGVLISLFPRAHGYWMYPVLLAYGFFFMATYPITEAALMECVPDAVRGRIFGLFITISGLAGNLSHWVIGDYVNHLGARAARPESYLPLYAVLSLMVLASLVALPCLHALRKREHLETAEAGAAPLSALRSPEQP